jgi:hypothetical protein
MKKFLFCTILSACFCIPAYCSQGYIFTTQNQKPQQKASVQVQKPSAKQIPYGEYLQFYNLDADNINADFIYLSHSDESTFLKSLDAEQKENYKYVKKIQKLIAKNDWEKVFSNYPNFYPAYLQYYHICYENENYTEALRILNKIKNLDPANRIFSQKIMNTAFAQLYYETKQYNRALNYYKMFEAEGDDKIILAIAKCYYNSADYLQAISYCKKLKDQTYEAKEIIYDSYMRLKDMKNAAKYAQELLQMEFNFTNLMRVQAMETNDSARLSYCYHARELATEEKDIRAVNRLIADLEQKKLDEAVAKTNRLAKAPRWLNFENQLPPNMTLQEIAAKQDAFFKTANEYLKQYKDQQLISAFNLLTQEYNNFIQSKQNQYHQEQQYLLQQQILEQQQRENELRQQMIYEQQMMNMMNRHNYYMNRHYPYNGFYDPFMYGW